MKNNNIANRSTVMYTDAIKKDFDLEQLVRNATWKDLLINLVETSKLDPWNIDISKIVEDYILVIREMKLMDLSIPANIVFAASFLLKLKSDSIPIFGEEEEIIEDVDTIERIIPDIPELIPRMRQPPHRKITLTELMNALEDVLKIENRKEKYFSEIEKVLPVIVDPNDMDEKMENAYKIAIENSDKYGMVMFEKLIKNMDTNLILLDLFVPLLFLDYNGKISLIQEVFFGDIIIKICK